jgi:hypothetical protein
MNMAIASFVFIVLFAVAIAHCVWALGGSWPIRDKALLARAVIGIDGIDKVPRLPSLGTAIFALGTGILALALADHDSGGIWLTLLAIPVAALFLARGALGYTTWWADRAPDPVFRLNDRRVYSPLCLFVGLGLLALVILRLY